MAWDEEHEPQLGYPFHESSINMLRSLDDPECCSVLSSALLHRSGVVAHSKGMTCPEPHPICFKMSSENVLQKPALFPRSVVKPPPLSSAEPAGGEGGLRTEQHPIWMGRSLPVTALLFLGS